MPRGDHDNDDFNMHTIEIILLQLSTGKPHPLAQNPRIVVGSARWPRPAIGIEIVGNHLALVTTHFQNPFRPDDRFYVFDWKKGVLKMVRTPFSQHSYLVSQYTPIPKGSPGRKS